MVIRSRRLKCRQKVPARARESGPGREQASVMDLDQGMDQAPVEIWALATSRSVVAVRVDRVGMAVELVVIRCMVLVVDLCNGRMCYPNRNRSTPRMRARIRSRGQLC